MAGESAALSLLGTYESSSDSERDSGYTSDEDKKRKCDTALSNYEHKTKRRRTDDNSMEEAMIVDSPQFSCKSMSRVPSFHSNSDEYRHFLSNQLHHYKPQQTESSHTKGNSYIPLPAELMQAGPSGYRNNVDDSSKHQGKIRSFPHDPGNWASIFYLHLAASNSGGLHLGSSTYNVLQNLVSSVLGCCKQHNLHLTPSSDFHISLSKTLLLRIHMIQPLAHHVRSALASVGSFKIWLNKFSVYVNEEKTRTFLGLHVLAGHSELAGIVAKLDRILNIYDLPPFYKECSLHASVAWVSGDQSKLLKSLLPMLEENFSHYFVDDADEQRSFNINHVYFKSGNRTQFFELGRHTTT